MTPNKTNPARHGFTLIELLVVISIIGILAGMVFAVGSVVKVKAKISAARGEMNLIKAALDTYHAKYNAYPPGNVGWPVASQLYYELSGTTYHPATFSYTTLDGASSITNVPSVFAGATGILNATKGNGGEDAAAAVPCLSGMSSKMLGTFSTNGYTVRVLVTSVGGPDEAHLAGLAAKGFSGNPFRYVYPGVKNPAGYDLWVQLVIKPGTTNLVCNWSSTIQVNTADP
jgi:prepilin-type N-terminal cleavage/methylation domain-containing protein